MPRRILATLLLASCCAWAQQAPTIRVTSELVLVDVVVRDSKGNFVPNLTAADFEVIDQGKTQKISAFETYRGGRPASGSAAPGTTGGPAASWLIIVVDGVNTTFQASGLALDALKKWLDAAPRSTPVMVAMLQRSQVRVQAPFTSDFSQALEFVRKASIAAQLPPGIEEAEAEIGRAGDLDEMMRRAANFGRLTEELVKESSTALKRFVATLGGYPGRKNLVFLTASYPLRPNQRLVTRLREFAGEIRDPAQTISRKLGQIPEIDLTETLREVATTANAFGVSFYPIDSRGLIAIAPPGVVAQLDQVTERQDTLFLLSSLTGGVPVFNTNSLEGGMQRAAEELGNYYLVGFRPEPDNKPRFHSLQVKLAKAGDYRVRSRRGYFSGMTDEQRLNAVMAAALGSPEAVTAIPFASRVTVNGQKVAVDVAIDAAAVRFTPAGGGVRAQLQLLGLVTKPDGSPVAKDYQISRTYNMELTPDQYKQVQAQQSVVTRSEFSLSKGEYQITLVVRDVSTGAVGALRDKISVP